MLYKKGNQIFDGTGSLILGKYRVFNPTHEQLIEAGWEEYIPETLKPTIQDYEKAVQIKIDETAQARGYDNGYTCASYADDKNKRYASDAKIFKDWRSDVWVYVNDLLNQYNEGKLKKIPAISTVLKNLPEIKWED